MTTHRDLPTIPTRDKESRVNGYLFPIANQFEGTGPFSLGKPVQQVYATTILPGAIKGPHLHLRRSGFFTPLVGEVAFVIRRGPTDFDVQYASRAKPRTIYVPAGVPSAMVNVGEGEAVVLNVVESAWRPEDPDDEPVPDFRFDFSTLKRITS
ncbi:MAG TPA: WxcM-like domain-containing protein [Candidatus Thermoplasmatota archaeon]|nr:WxcM-like domain-containing protein [Candidatus Thermoplasmatota archaeon]